jgi:hypothetical protein
VLLLLAIRVLILLYGGYGCVRGRYRPGVVLVVPALVMVLLPILMLLSGAGLSASFLIWLLPLLAATPVAFVTRLALRALNEQRAESERATQLETASFALLANALIDTAMFVLAAAAMALLGRDGS